MVLQKDVMTKVASNSRPSLLKGYNYGFWKLRMKAYIHSIDERAWMTMEEGYLSPNKSENGVTVSKPRSEWSANEFELVKWHHRVVNAIFGDITNQCQALGTPISGERLNWKIPRSLPKRFKAKVTAIEKKKDVDVMSLDELLGSLQTCETCLKPKAKSKGLALKVVKKASSEDDGEIALLVRKFKKFLRKGAKLNGKYSKEKEVKKSFTLPHERSGHTKSNIKSEDDDSSDEESPSEEELVSNFVAFTASPSIPEDVCQDSLDKEVDPNHQECLSDNPTYVDLLAKLQVDEFVSTTRMLFGEKNALAKKLKEVEGVVLERVRIISNLSLGDSSVLVVEEKLIEASLPTSEENVIVDKKALKKRHPRPRTN
ncbi:hypothetical protein QYF36_013079 [Acer negundo]|nr:hypothetical protein QYF36_013079 [Acer negundo]